MIAKTSRYAGIENETWSDPDGRKILYLGRRLLPALEILTDLTGHTVCQGERLDHIAWAYLGDPELFWRICDANPELNPPDLTTEAGRKIQVPQMRGF